MPTRAHETDAGLDLYAMHGAIVTSIITITTMKSVIAMSIITVITIITPMTFLLAGAEKQLRSSARPR